jgi:hypothetical protein
MKRRSEVSEVRLSFDLLGGAARDKRRLIRGGWRSEK